MEKKIRKTKSITLYQGRVVKLSLDTYRTADGHSFRRETIRHPVSVVILPVFSDGRVVLIRQFRHAIGRYIYEIPAGTSEAGETPLECAKRELAEETGFRARNWKQLCYFYPAPGVSTEKMFLFRASHLSKLAKKVAMDADEYIIRQIVSADKAIRLVRENKVMDAKTMLGILMGLNRIRW